MRFYYCGKCGVVYALRAVHGDCKATYVNAVGGMSTCEGLLIPLTTPVGEDKQFVPPDNR